MSYISQYSLLIFIVAPNPRLAEIKGSCRIPTNQEGELVKI